MEQHEVSSSMEYANTSNGDSDEVDRIVDELLAEKPHLTSPQLFQLFRLDITPTGRIAKELLRHLLDASEVTAVIIRAIQKGCIDDIMDAIPAQMLHASQLQSIMREINALTNQEKRAACAHWCGTMLLSQKEANAEDLLFIISAIPVLREAAWERLVSLKNANSNRIGDALLYFSGEAAKQKAAWFLAKWPNKAGNIMQHSETEVSRLGAECVLTQTDFDDSNISKLITWATTFKDTNIPQRAIDWALRGPKGANTSLCSIIDSPLATEAQKEQAAGLLLGTGIEIAPHTLESIVSSAPMYAKEAQTRMQEKLAAKERGMPRSQLLINRLIDLDTEYRLRVQ